MRWAVLGTGVIANEMAAALHDMGRSLYAVGNRTPEKARSFAEKHGVCKVYDHFQQMFSDPDVDIIYLTTPHNTHIGFLEEALSHGKHVLCEKSITLNSRELSRAAALAQQNGVVLAEAMTVYHMPLYKELRRRISDGELGRVNLIQANFGSFKDYDMNNRFFHMGLAGGALLDIGVYALSRARYFLEETPDEIRSLVRYAPSGADETSGIVAMNPRGQLVTATLSLHSKQPKRVVISCEKGYIEVMEYPRADRAAIVWTQTGKTEQLHVGETARALQYELGDMERAVLGQSNEMCFPYTQDVMALMTGIRRDWGMFYNDEII